VTFMDNFCSILLVLGLSGESKSVLGLAVGNLVNPEPFVGGSDQAREVPFHVLYVVELAGKRIGDIHHDHFPIGLALIQESHDTEDLNLLDLSDISNLLADLADIQRIIVASRLRLSMRHVGIFPCLREGAVVPDVPVMREAVADEAQSALFDVLLDRVERLLLGYLHLGIGPTRHLDDHVEDAIGLVSKEGDVVEGRQDSEVVLNVDAVL